LSDTLPQVFPVFSHGTHKAVLTHGVITLASLGRVGGVGREVCPRPGASLSFFEKHDFPAPAVEKRYKLFISFKVTFTLFCKVTAPAMNHRALTPAQLFKTFAIILIAFGWLRSGSKPPT
jgi:hypothetical protein